MPARETENGMNPHRDSEAQRTANLFLVRATLRRGSGQATTARETENGMVNGGRRRSATCALRQAQGKQAVPGHRTPNYVAGGALGRPLRLCPSLGLWALTKLQSSSEPLRLCVEVVALCVSAYQRVSRTRCKCRSLGPETRMLLCHAQRPGGLVFGDA